MGSEPYTQLLLLFFLYLSLKYQPYKFSASAKWYRMNIKNMLKLRLNWTRSVKEYCLFYHLCCLQCNSGNPLSKPFEYCNKLRHYKEIEYVWWIEERQVWELHAPTLYHMNWPTHARPLNASNHCWLMIHQRSLRNLHIWSLKTEILTYRPSIAIN